MQVHDKLFIGGEWVDPAGHRHASRSSLPTPRRSSPGCPTASAADIDNAVAAARGAFDTGRGRGWSPPSVPTSWPRSAGRIQARSQD